MGRLSTAGCGFEEWRSKARSGDGKGYLAIRAASIDEMGSYALCALLWRLFQLLRCRKPLEFSLARYHIFPTLNIEFDFRQSTSRHAALFACQKSQQLFKPRI